MEPSEIDYPKVKAALMKKLYKESLNILQLKPWRVLSDNNPFVFVNPDNGEKYLVAVMGNAGKIFGLDVYLPDEGTKLYTMIASSANAPSNQEKLAQYAIRKCRKISLSFEEDEFIEDHDLDLEDRFAGPEWLEVDFADEQLSEDTTAVFRQVKPHCPPFHINNEDALKLTDALVILPVFLTSSFKTNEFLSTFDTLVNNRYEKKLPTYRLKDGEDRFSPDSWMADKETFTQDLSEKEPDIPEDDLFAARISRYKKLPEIWQTGAIYIDEPILENGVPMFTTLSVVAVESSSMAVGSTVHAGEVCLATLLRKAITKASEELEYYPSVIKVSSELAYKALSPLSDFIEIRMVNRNECAEFTEIANHMNAQFEGNRTNPLHTEDLREEEMAQLQDLQAELMRLESSGELDEAVFHKLVETKLTENPSLKESLNRLQGESSVRVYTPPKSQERYIFRVDIKGIKPPIWRRISIPKDASFFDLHRAIQAVFGWAGHHLHEFLFKHGNWGLTHSVKWVADKEPFVSMEHYDEVTTKLSDLFCEGGFDKCVYYYDFGDDWEHIVKFEGVEILDDPEVPILALIKGKGPMMLDDCGGVWGFKEILEGSHPYQKDIESANPHMMKNIEEWYFDVKDIHCRPVEFEMESLDERNNQRY